VSLFFSCANIPLYVYKKEMLKQLLVAESADKSDDVLEINYQNKSSVY
jgi:hypothetical protein